MQRLRDERGAVGVVVALLMVPLIGFAAIAIDLSASWAQKEQLQTGADAGALAIAQDCARGICGSPSLTAQSLATLNMNSDAATATVTELTSSRVTVRNSGARDFWFAPILGVDSSAINTRATVTWGAPVGGTALLPLAFSWCEWQAQTGGAMPSGTTARTILFPKSSDAPCSGPSGLPVPAGFGWLATDANKCQTTSAISGIIQSDPGNSVPSTCSTSDLVAQHGRTVLMPIFDQVSGTGSGATYRVYAYAAFTLTGYHFGGQNTWNSPCGGSARCIRGYFTKLVAVSDAFTYGAGAPNLGASIVTLTD